MASDSTYPPARTAQKQPQAAPNRNILFDTGAVKRSITRPSFDHVSEPKISEATMADGCPNGCSEATLSVFQDEYVCSPFGEKRALRLLGNPFAKACLRPVMHVLDTQAACLDPMAHIHTHTYTSAGLERKGKPQVRGSRYSTVQVRDTRF